MQKQQFLSKAYENIRPTLQLFNLKGDLLKENIYRIKKKSKSFYKTIP